MSKTILSDQRDDYLLIKSSGVIEDVEEYTSLTAEYYGEISRHGAKKTIIDERELEFPGDIYDQYAQAKYLDEELPFEIRFLKLAIVVDIKHKEAGEFWQDYCHNRGVPFRIFHSMEDAVAFMSE